MLRGADRLRRSLVPSLLESRRTNESLANPVIELFETAKIYLPEDRPPRELWMLALTSGRDFRHLKGVIESIMATLGIDDLVARPWRHELLDPQAACRIEVHGQLLGYLGQLSGEGGKRFGLRGRSTVAELLLEPLFQSARLVRKSQPLSPFPAMVYDLNLIVDEAVRWSQVISTVREAGSDIVENVDYLETYRSPDKDGPGKKRFIFSLTMRSDRGTLTGEQAEATRDRIVAACRKRFAARLLS
jgi:phenylalanyl-tRNA synthetase beta chain